MPESKVTRLAKAYGQGKASADQVVSALKLTGHVPAKDAEELIRREEEQTDGYSYAPNDWTDVVGVYMQHGLTREQYRELYKAMGGT